MYITICKIDDQFDAWTGHSKPVLWDNPGGWGVEGGGRGVQDGGDMCTCAYMTMYGKNTTEL